MPRLTAAAPAATPQKVNVSVDMPQNAPDKLLEEKEERSPTWFWDMLQDIPKEKWGNTYDVMGFRIDPKPSIAPGGKGFLFQIFEPITPMWIKQNYGGGKFRCILEKNSRFLKSHEFDIEGTAIYDLSRERPNVPAANGNGNADIGAFQKEFISVLREELARSREATQGTTQGTDKVVEMLTNASEKAMEIVTKQTPGATNSTEQLAQLVTIVKGLMPPPATDGGLLGSILKPLLEKLVTPVDPMAQITMFLTIFEKIDAIRGGGESKPKDWRAMLAEGVVQKGPEMLRELRETFTVNKDAAEAKRAAAEAQERTATAIRSIPPANPAPAAPGGTVPTTTVMPSGPLRTVPIDRANGAAPADVIPSNVAPVAAPGMSPVESDAVANFMQHRIVEMIADDRDAEDVVDFIEEVDPSMNDLLVQFSPEMVTTFLSSRPIISEATQFPNWNAFLTAAQSYIKEIREEDKAIAAAAGAVPS